jgi:hypothetical protein
METGERPLYESKASGKNLWQHYRVWPDRIELGTLFGTVKVPLEDVSDVSVRPPVVIFDLFRGDYDLGELMRAPKLDLADLYAHVAIEKETGFWRQLRVTPDDPEAFVAAVRQAREQRSRAAGTERDPS